MRYTHSEQITIVWSSGEIRGLVEWFIFYVFCKDAIVYSQLICVLVHSIGHVGGQVLCGWRIGVVAVEHTRVEGGNVAYSWTPSMDSLHYGAKRRICFELMLSCEISSHRWSRLLCHLQPKVSWPSQLQLSWPEESWNHCVLPTFICAPGFESIVQRRLE